MSRELVYIWVNNYRCFSDQGFNLSSRWRFSFQANTCELKRHSVESRIPNYFPQNVTDVMAIVGENGSGKSTLFDLIKSTEDGLMQLLTGVDLSKRSGDFVVVFFENSTSAFYACSTYPDLKTDQLTELRKVNDLESVFYQSTDIEISTLEPLYIYYSNMYDGRREFDHPDLINISTNFLLSLPKQSVYSEINQYNYSNLSQKEIFERIEVRKQLSFFRKFQFDFPFLLPSSLSLNVHYKKPDFQQIELTKEYKSVLENLFEKNDAYLVELNDRWHNLERKIKEGRDSQYRDREEQKEETRALFLGAMLSNFIRNSDRYQNNLLHQGKQWPSVSQFSYNDSISSVENIERFFEIIGGSVYDLASYLGEQNRFGLESRFIIPFDEIARFFDLFESYLDYFENFRTKKEGFYRQVKEFISFHWGGFSSGQMNLFSQLSRFYHCREAIAIQYDHKKHLFIMIDEGDVGFHPQWQKRYFSILMEILPKIFENFTFQLIIASNSSFLLSDLPENNSLLFKNLDGNTKVQQNLDRQTCTLAANIYTMLTDSFFIEDFPIGDYAKKKINNAIDLLTQEIELSDQKINEIQILITHIGEPVIKNRLNNLLSEKSNSTLLDQIKELKEKIKVLENKKTRKRKR